MVEDVVSMTVIDARYRVPARSTGAASSGRPCDSVEAMRDDGEALSMFARDLHRAGPEARIAERP
jgi:hypothetical protein